ncbi:YeaH/YhbH family protein [Sneathiella sp.]|jgi:sporulation protein YhbH|uniref:YeaH/YhbH family protein n=1 Tax=Sneathiella sp. TaxID=1964365 RepID=UPI0039E697CF
MGAVFRPYSPTDSLQSDRSSGDRQRHREKLRDVLKENIADVISEQSIIGRDGDNIIKIPIKGIKEYRFVYGPNNPRVAQGNGGTEPGDKVGKVQQEGDAAEGEAGDQPGEDYYETDVTLDELVEIMFEDLELPDLESKPLRAIESEYTHKRSGTKRVGIRAHLDKKRTVKNRIRRRFAHQKMMNADQEGKPSEIDEAEEKRFPFSAKDFRFHRHKPDIRYESNAVVICLMDTSGSMNVMKKYLARSFFFLLYQFVRLKYRQTELVFIAHDTKAKEVSEDDFFHKGESGGTMISSGYRKALDIIHDRFDPSMWNIYAFHCSDGDNFQEDVPRTLALARELCACCNLFGYGEIKPVGGIAWGTPMLQHFDELTEENFTTIGITAKSDVWPKFKAFLSRDRERAQDFESDFNPHI